MNSNLSLQSLFIQFGWPAPHRRWACIAGMLIGLTLILLWQWPAPAYSDDPSFDVPRFFGTGSDETLSVALGDMNGDGVLDIVVGNSDSSNGQNIVYLNDGIGHFDWPGAARNFGTASDETLSVAVGDMNGDGALDIVTGNNYQQNVVYLNDGTGHFDRPDAVRNFGTGSDVTESIAVGDIDGDGALDIVVGNSNRQNVVYLNDGVGNFDWPGAARDFGTGSDDTQSLALGDVDGDGALDIVVGNASGEQNVVYLNDGNGNFSIHRIQDFGTGSDKTSCVKLGDVDGDGALDIVVGNTLGEQNVVYLNDGSGSFSTHRTRDFGTGSDKTSCVELGDVDGDGDLDIVVGNTSDEPNAIYLNDGAGNFDWSGAIHYFGTGTDDTQSVTLGDVDGNGALDLIVGNMGEPNAVYLNDGTGYFPRASTRDFGTGLDDTQSIAVGDVNGDGALDLVVGNAGEPNAVYLNDGTGYFPIASARYFGTGSDDTQSIAVGDMNNDGALDIVAGNASGEQNVVHINDGAGNFDWPGADRSFGTGSDDTRSVAVGDVDGDGDLDIVVGNSPSESNSIALNDGGGHFDWPGHIREFGTGSDDTWSVALGDVNGDGALDIVAGNMGEPNAVCLNDGTGRFPIDNVRSFGTGSDDTRSVALGDADGDGTLDLVVGNDHQPNIVYLNDGAGNFDWPDAARNFGTGSDVTRSVALGDVNGDGALDVVVGNASQNVVYLNDRAGQFDWSTPIRDFGTGSDNTQDVVLGDVNGDGFLDLIVGNYHQPDVVYINRHRLPERLANSPLRITVDRPCSTANANFYSSPEILEDLTLPITYTLFDPDGSTAARIAAYYSLDGGGRWYTATATSGTATTNLSTRLPEHYSSGNTFPITISSTSNSVSSTLVVPGIQNVDDIDVWLNITHTYDADLDVYLRSPDGTLVELFTDVGGEGNGFIGTVLDDEAAISIVSTSVSAPFTGHFRPEGSLADFDGEATNGVWTLWITDTFPLENDGALLSWGINLQAGSGTHVFTWDTFASGVFGQSDNVVFRIEAYPQAARSGITGTYRYTKSTPGPYQWPYAIAATFPFRVRGTQVRVLSGTTPISNAMVYRLPEGQPAGGFPLANGGGVPFRTNNQGYLQGRGHVDIGDQLMALVPVHTDLSYEGMLDFDGADDYVIRNPLLNAPITKTTISFWMRSEDTTGGGTLLSYATPNEDDEFLITDYNNLTIRRGQSVVSSGISATDGIWHHIAVTWLASDGQVTLYKDGVVAFTGTLTTTPLVPGGSLVLGQNQNSVGGDFEPDDAFRGELDEVRIWNVIRSQTQIQADMFWALQENQPGLILYWPFNDHSENTASDQSNNGNLGMIEGATWEGESTGGYTVYYTSGEPTEIGLNMFTVTEPGLQTLTVTANHPIILFDLHVSLEWDASNDPTYLQQLAFDLKKASQYLYDFTNGQAALGNVTVHQNADDWAFSHIVVHATNHMRPFAAQGGIVLTPTVDPEHNDIIYDAGQVHMGATWNRYGTPGENLGLDWPLILAHELSHHLLYLDDVYMGLNDDGLLIPVNTCTGSAMGDVYNLDNTEFIYDEDHWNANCADTLTERTLERNEWETLELWYPWLVTPVITNPGPSLLPFNLTAVQVMDPITPTNGLEDPTFYLDYVEQEVSSSEARAFLLRDDEHVIDLGSPVGGQNRLLARGARLGDRLCVFDRPRHQYGCEIIESGDERLALERDETWTPLIQLSPVNSTTFDIQVSTLPAGLVLRARLYPEYGSGSEVITLTPASEVYSGTLHLPYPVLAGHVQVWADETATEIDPRREAIAAYSIAGNPGLSRGHGGLSRGHGGLSRGHGGLSRGHGGLSRGHGAPLVSPDGQMTFFTENPTIFNEGELYTIQNMAGLPSLPAGKVVVGQGYQLVASPNITRILTGSISFQYLEHDALTEGVDEGELNIHFWDGSSWQALDSVRSPYYNLVSASSQGNGIYTLLGGVTTPAITSVVPSAATNDVTTTLIIDGSYFLPPVEVTLVGPTSTHTLPLLSVSPFSITAVVTQGLPASEYQVVVANLNEPTGPATSPTPGIFALYDPADACFYDFFESGDGKWQRGGEWGIVTLSNGGRALTDSPAGPYKSAGDYESEALTYTTYITSQAFSLSNCVTPVLIFRHDYVIVQADSSQDIGRVEISADNGTTWTELESYSGGDTFDRQDLKIRPSTSFEWTDVHWQNVKIDLSPYTGTVHLRFGLEVDRYLSDKGWVIDDVVVKTNPSPSPPGRVVFLPMILKKE